MTVNTLKQRKLIVLSTAIAFLIGSAAGAPLLESVNANTAIANNPIHVNVDNSHRGGASINRDRGNNNRRNNHDNDKKDNNKNHKNNNNDNKKDNKNNNRPDKKVIRKTVIRKRPIVINTGGETVVDRTVQNVTENIIENNNNNNNNNENINDNIVEVNTGNAAPVREVVYETRTGYPVYVAPASVTYTPDTGAGALSFLALIPGGVAALLRKRFFT